MKNKGKWLAAHLYYSEPWEPILKKGVIPFVKDIMKNKLAEQYFFIRYWEKGPHIRLRFKANEDIIESQIKPKLIKYFEDFFKIYPSKREEPEWTEKTDKKYIWYPNNSIQFIEYEPEIERYGGKFGIFTAEKQFMASSKSILDIIENEENYTYENALGFAIQLHLSFAFAFGLTIEEIKYFFNFVSTCWFPRAIYNYYNMDDENKVKYTKEVRNAFKQSYNGQKQILKPFIDEFTKNLKENSIENEVLNNWIEENRKIKTQLENLINENKLNINEMYLEKIKIPKTNKIFKAITILESYVHMTNNRLGIQNRDEAFLGYLISETLNKTSENL